MSDVRREKPWMCYGCGYTMDAIAPAHPVVREVPIDGDVTHCRCCGEVFSRHRGRWFPLSHLEWTSLAADERANIERISEARRAIYLDSQTRGRGGRA